MKINPFSGNARDELPDPEMNYSCFRPLSSPKENMRKDYFAEANPFHFGGLAHDANNEFDFLLGGKPTVREKDMLYNDFGNPFRTNIRQEPDDEINFLFNDNLSPESFKRPFEKKDSERSSRDSETASHTKEASLTINKRESPKNSFDDTHGDNLSWNQKRFSCNEVTYFQDLCPVREQDMPDLNSLISLSIIEGDSSLSMKLCSCQLTNCKLLHNFLNGMEESDLSDLQKILKETKEDIAKELAKLQGQVE